MSMTPLRSSTIEREEQQLKSESGKRKPHIVFYVSHTQSSQGTTRTSANSQLLKYSLSATIFNFHYYYSTSQQLEYRK